MPDTETLVTETKTTETKQPAQAASRGKITRAEYTPPQTIDGKIPPQPANDIAASHAGVKLTDGNNHVDKGITETVADKEVVKDALPKLSDDQRKAFLQEMFGEENADVEKIKEKLKPVEVLPTDEQKKKAEADKELRLVELFIKNGGTLDQFNQIKSIANADVKELSKKDAIQEYVAAGFSEDEAKDIVKVRYFQNELDNIEQDVDNDESDEDFAKRKATLQKKIEFGSKKLETKSSHKIQQAGEVLKSLQQAYDSEILQQQAEAKNSSNVDELLTKMPRKVTYELGKINDQEIPPIEHEVSDESIKQVAEILKDPAKRNNIFNNEDGTLNLSKISQLLINNFEYERSLKNAYLEGGSRQVAIFEKTFPARSAYELGVGGTLVKNTDNGTVTQRGKRQVVSPTINN